MPGLCPVMQGIEDAYTGGWVSDEADQSMQARIIIGGQELVVFMDGAEYWVNSQRLEIARRSGGDNGTNTPKAYFDKYAGMSLGQIYDDAAHEVMGKWISLALKEAQRVQARLAQKLKPGKAIHIAQDEDIIDIWDTKALLARATKLVKSLGAKDIHMPTDAIPLGLSVSERTYVPKELTLEMKLAIGRRLRGLEKFHKAIMDAIWSALKSSE